MNPPEVDISGILCIQYVSYMSPQNITQRGAARDTVSVAYENDDFETPLCLGGSATHIVEMDIIMLHFQLPIKLRSCPGDLCRAREGAGTWLADMEVQI